MLNDDARAIAAGGRPDGEGGMGGEGREPKITEASSPSNRFEV